ncbi:MAG: OmpA family protein [Elusimicrobia bacterium]|nr:OmpA family protein [Elusimicrobiota bacterium]
MKRTFLSVLLIGSVAGSLWANDATGRIGIGGAAGWSDLIARDEARQATHADYFSSGWLRYGISEKNELILGVDSIQFKVKDDSDASHPRIRPLTVGLYHSFRSAGRLIPVATLGVGAADVRWMDPSGDRSKTTFAAQGGLGLEYFLMNSFSVGALARIHYVYNESTDYRTEATAYTAGLMANLFWGGKNSSPQSAATPAPAPAATPAEVAPPVAVAATPIVAAAAVPAVPVDSDGDGIVDSADVCPNTPAGTLVNEKGCPTETVSVTLDIKFDSGKADLKPEYDAQLSKGAAFLKSHPDTTVVIEGHTDNQGSADGNKALSQKRADAIRNALVDRFAVAGNRVSAKGFGAAVPLQDNGTPEGRAANRRVVATISAVKK